MRRRRATAKVRPVAHEHREQVEVVRWLRAAKILHFAVPNGARTSMSVARKLKAEGMVSGVPDLFILDAPPNAPGKVGVALEMKRTKGGTVSPEQRDWMAQLAIRGWETKVCHGAAEALTWLAVLGYRVPRSSP